MENFFYSDGFYSDIEGIFTELDFDEDHLEDIEDDWKVECQESDLEPVVKLTPEWICEHINEERFREDGDEWDKIYAILKDNIDFDKINLLIPELYYPSRRKFTITKQDIVDYWK